MNHLLFLGNLGWGELLIIALVVLLVFGGKKIPELMKGLGKGVRSFKEGTAPIRRRTSLNSSPPNEPLWTVIKASGTTSTCCVRGFCVWEVCCLWHSSPSLLRCPPSSMR